MALIYLAFLLQYWRLKSACEALLILILCIWCNDQLLWACLTHSKRLGRKPCVSKPINLFLSISLNSQAQWCRTFLNFRFAPFSDVVSVIIFLIIVFCTEYSQPKYYLEFTYEQNFFFSIKTSASRDCIDDPFS